MDFIEVSIKSIKITLPVSKITKFGREIVAISIISPVQTHKLLIPQEIYRNFDIFPQKCILKQVVTPIWGTIGAISPIFTKFTYFLSSPKYIIQRVYAINRVKIHIVKIHIVKRLTLKRFNVKSYYFLYFAQVLKLLHTTAQAHYLTKIQIQIFLTNTISTTAQSTAVFSTIAHLLFHNRCQCSHISSW